jgi:hypothetical protein
MNAVRNAMLFILGGAIVGNVGSALVGSRFLPWYNQPGGAQSAALCPCTEVTTNVAHAMLHYQLWGLLIGAAVGLVLYLILMRRSSKTPTQKAPTQQITGATPSRV